MLLNVRRSGDVLLSVFFVEFMLDQLAARINQLSPGANLKMLSGLPREQLIDALTGFHRQLDQLPRNPDVDLSSEDDGRARGLRTAAAHGPPPGAVVQVRRDGIEVLEDAAGRVLPITRDKMRSTVQLYRSMLTDLDADVAVVSKGLQTLTEAEQRALVSRQEGALDRPGALRPSRAPRRCCGTS